SATNVAVAAARHGRRSAVITATGADPFGRFVHQELVRLGVDDRVTLLGPRDDVPDLLLAADLLLHPARNEAAGTVLIEALAAGLPVLCSGNCGFADHVRDSGGAVLEQPFSQRNFNKTLLRLLSTPETLADLRQNALGYGQNGDFYHRAEVAAKIIRGEE
ncbi:MAG: glycosyltransferase, partial [Lentisphaeria bacterium]|nr:glycosyltransferase [Lentisphaeria bacterium]